MSTNLTLNNSKSKDRKNYMLAISKGAKSLFF